MSGAKSVDERPSGQEPEAWRAPAERDIDRILYASAYRRLAGVTQVLPAGEQPLVHNRLTHTLKVQQVAKRTAQWLKHESDPESIKAAGGLSPAIVEAAAAAHDLGHPPFGHVAEDELQDILDKGARLADGFEGNAQTFRIVTKLAVRKEGRDGEGPDGLGLDLTYGTLAGISKYPWCRGEHAGRGTPKDHDEYYAKKWGAYETERDALGDALSTVPSGRIRALSAEVMDFADDVTYAVHDIEDFFRLGLIPLHEIALGATSGGRSEVLDDFWDFAAAEIESKGEIPFNPGVARERLFRLADLMPAAPYQDSDRDRLALHRFISESVATFQSGLTITRNGLFKLPPPSRMLIEVLKELTWYFVIEHPALATLQQGQRRVIRELVQWLDEWVTQNDPETYGAQMVKRRKVERRRLRELPARLLGYLAAGIRDSSGAQPEDAIRLRAVVDFVASLTEAEAYSLHRRLGGTDISALLPLGLVR